MGRRQNVAGRPRSTPQMRTDVHFPRRAGAQEVSRLYAGGTEDRKTGKGHPCSQPGKGSEEAPEMRKPLHLLRRRVGLESRSRDAARSRGSRGA